jgi:hypothetical protein
MGYRESVALTTGDKHVLLDILSNLEIPVHPQTPAMKVFLRLLDLFSCIGHKDEFIPK